MGNGEKVLFLKSFILRRPGVAIFADIIKIVSKLIKTVIKDSREVRRIRNYVSKWNLYLYFLIQQSLLICSKKILVSTEIKYCVT